MTELYPGADQDEKDGYFHDTVPAKRDLRNQPSNDRMIPGDVDLPRLVAALHELSKAFVHGEQGRYGMCIPAEPYHDGDLVCGQAARMICLFSEQWASRCKEVERLRAALSAVAGYNWNGDVRTLIEVAQAALSHETAAPSQGDCLHMWTVRSMRDPQPDHVCAHGCGFTWKQRCAQELRGGPETTESGTPRVEAGDRAGPLVSPSSGPETPGDDHG